jgi:putative flavoprotein involved in K+ transport
MDMKTERYDTVIIGAGQAGLATGYHLATMGRSFVMLEAGARVGDSWRSRWDSLRLFTPSEANGLPGMRFPARRWTFPTKDEMADFLERYAAAFDLPVRTRTSVTRLGRSADGFVVETAGDVTYEADNVVVTTGANRTPKIPDFALELDARTLQIHSSEYRSPAQLRPGAVLIVGARNSGAEIAVDVAPTRRVLLSGHYWRAPGGPSRSPILNLIMYPVLRHLITIDTPLGRRARASRGPGGGGEPVERVTLKQLDAAGVTRVPRVERIEDGRPVLADGSSPEVANVIWCTGYRPGLEWIDLPIHDERGEARQVRGVAVDVPGLYFVGRPFQYAPLSAAVAGVGRDAGYVAKQIRKRTAMRSAKVQAESAPA